MPGGAPKVLKRLRRGTVSGLGFRVWGLGFGFRVWGGGFRGLFFGVRVQGLGLGV